MHELALASAIARRRRASRRGQAGHGRLPADRRPAADLVPESLEALLRDRRARVGVRRARLDYEVVPAVLRCRECGTESVRGSTLHLPGLQLGRCRGYCRRGVPDRIDRTGGRRMHRTRVTVLEDVLDANSTIAQANRLVAYRAASHRREPDECPGRRQDLPARGHPRRSRRDTRRGPRRGCADDARRRPDREPARARHPDHDRPRLWRRVSPRREHGAVGPTCDPARRDRSPDHRERGQPRLSPRVPRRRGSPCDGLVGSGGRGQAAQVPPHVPVPRLWSSSTRSIFSTTSISISSATSRTSRPSIQVSNACS